MANSEWRMQGIVGAERFHSPFAIRHSPLAGHVDGEVTLKDVRKVYAGGVEAVKGITLRRAGRAFLRAGRPVGLRQVDAAAHDRRRRDHHVGRDPHRRARRERHRAVRARHRDGVPELRALSAYARLRQHGLRPAQPQNAEGRDRQAACARPRASSRSSRCSTASRASSPAGSASASRWAARSCAGRRRSCSTSRCRTSTPSCASRRGSRSRSCRRTSAPRRSTSRTTSSRR